MEMAGRVTADGAFAEARHGLPDIKMSTGAGDDKDALPESTKRPSGSWKPWTPTEEEEDELQAPKGLPGVRTPRLVEKPKAEDQVVSLPEVAGKHSTPQGMLRSAAPQASLEPEGLEEVAPTRWRGGAPQSSAPGEREHAEVFSTDAHLRVGDGPMHQKASPEALARLVAPSTFLQEAHLKSGASGNLDQPDEAFGIEMLHEKVERPQGASLNPRRPEAAGSGSRGRTMTRSDEEQGLEGFEFGAAGMEVGSGDTRIQKPKEPLGQLHLASPRPDMVRRPRQTQQHVSNFEMGILNDANDRKVPMDQQEELSPNRPKRKLHVATLPAAKGTDSHSSSPPVGIWGATQPEFIAVRGMTGVQTASPEFQESRVRSAQFSPDVSTVLLTGHGQDEKDSSVSPALILKRLQVLPLAPGSHEASARNHSLPPKYHAASPVEEEQKSSSVPPKEGAFRTIAGRRRQLAVKVASIGGILSVANAPKVKAAAQGRKVSPQRDASRDRGSPSVELAAALAGRIQGALSKRYGSVEAAAVDMQVQLSRLPKEDLAGAAPSPNENEGQLLPTDRRKDLRTVMVQAGASYKDATILLQALAPSDGDAQGLTIRDVVIALQPGQLKQEALDATKGSFLRGDDPNINLGSLQGISNLDARTILEKHLGTTGLNQSRSRSGSPKV